MSWKPIDSKDREKTPIGRFEIICARYINGSGQEKELILSLMDDSEKALFLQGCGLYKMFADRHCYDMICDAMEVMKCTNV